MVSRFTFILVLVAALLAVMSTSAVAAGPTYAYTFEPHSSFFSAETKQASVVDPQVFVADSAVAAGTGPQNITHIAGYRPARTGSDSATDPLYTSQGKPLGITLGAWLGASGTGTIACSGDAAVATNTFRGLIPGGLYQATRLQFTTQGAKRTPLGPADNSNSTFVAGPDGTAVFTTSLPFCPGPTEGVVLAYHSDGQSHGAAMGDIGVNLHNQLATRFPAASSLPRSGGTPLGLVVGLGLGLIGLGLGVSRRARRAYRRRQG